MRFNTRYLLAFGALCALFCVSSPAFADSLSAGFPLNPIWLSSTALTDGNSATINTLIYNSSSETITGDVLFTMDNVALGTKQFSSGPGTNQVIPYPWTAVVGQHSFSASIENENAAGEVTTQLVSTQTGTTTVMVAAAPPSPVPSAAVSYASNAASSFISTIASTSPALANIASTTIAAGESVRQDALSSLQSLASSTGSIDGRDTTASTSPAGEVLGAFDYHAPTKTSSTTSSKNGIFDFFEKTWLGILGLLIAICKSPLWFYLLLLVVIVLLVKLVMTILADNKRNRRRR